MVEEFAAAAGRDEVAAAEARARMAAIDHEMKSYFPDGASFASERMEPATLAKAIVGDWTSPFLSLSVRGDGTFATQLPDGSRSEGHWSLDADGQLHVDLMGAPVVAGVSVDGDDLTMLLNGQAIKLRREASD